MVFTQSFVSSWCVSLYETSRPAFPAHSANYCMFWTTEKAKILLAFWCVDCHKENCTSKLCVQIIKWNVAATSLTTEHKTMQILWSVWVHSKDSLVRSISTFKLAKLSFFLVGFVAVIVTGKQSENMEDACGNKLQYSRAPSNKTAG